MNYPLHLSFKALALGQKLSVTDATGRLVLFVKQKAFKLKEDVTVFADEAQTQPLYHIRADRMIDFSARYSITDAAGASLGAVKRKGMASLWRSRFEVFDGDALVMTIAEENPWVKVADAVLSGIPILGLLSGYLFHPRYLLSRADGTVVLSLEKQPAFLEGKFKLERRLDLSEADERRALLSLLMMVLLERQRG